jgi:hypothetical protein
MENDSSAKLREKIYQMAAAHAEATVYTLENTYLSKEEKTEVELWFQLPGNMMVYSYLIVVTWSAAYGQLNWSIIIGIPVVVNIIVGLLNWHFNNKIFVFRAGRAKLDRCISEKIAL